ncbi:hypothetical protein H311_03114, partial [Anncaliia algerae PRA109]
IKPGSIVVTDCWVVYKTLYLYGYSHFKVNHSNYSLAPDTGYNTNRIKSF